MAENGKAEADIQEPINICSVSSPLKRVNDTSSVVNGGTSLNLQRYIVDYSGMGKIIRLQFIARKCSQLSREAYKFALAELRRGTNVDLHQEIENAAQQDHGPGIFPTDTHWEQSTTRRVLSLQSELEAKLKTRKQNQLRDQIRNAYIELAEFHCKCGEFPSALARYVEARDYCESVRDQIELSLRMVETSIQQRSLSHVKAEVQRALALDDPFVRSAVVRGKFYAARGLYFMRLGSFAQAVENFREVPFELNGKFKEVLSGRDIAVYGGLCAMATCSRRQLKDQILDNDNFKNFLELTPNLLSVMNDFHSSAYGQCMANLERMKANLLIDYYLAQHIPRLFQLIRAKALTQYFSPFTAVDMRKMADAFQVSIESLEEEVSNLIIDGKIQGRIDSHQKVLHARSTDKRAATFAKGLRAGARFVAESRAALLRMSLTRAGLVVRAEGEGDRERGDGAESDDRRGPRRQFARKKHPKMRRQF
eukprot:195257_1